MMAARVAFYQTLTIAYPPIIIIYTTFAQNIQLNHVNHYLP